MISTLTELSLCNIAQPPTVGACPGLTLAAVLHPTLGEFICEAEERTREYEFAAIIAETQAKGFATGLDLRYIWARRRTRREQLGVQAYRMQHHDLLALLTNYSFFIERGEAPNVG